MSVIDRAPTGETPADLIEPPVRLPTPPEAPRPASFPLIAVLAPVAIGVTLAMLLGAGHFLLFAVFGPVIAIAHVIDRRVGGRRRLRRASAVFDTELAAARDEIDAAHARIRRRRCEAHPAAGALVAGARRIEPGAVVGATTMPSGLRTEGGGADARLDAVRLHAARLDDAAFAIEARRIRVLGPRAIVSGVVRALVVQLTADDPALPFSVHGEAAEQVRTELESAGVGLDGHEHWIDTGRGAGPADAEIALTADGSGTVVLADGRRIRIRADALGAGELRGWAARLAAAQGERDAGARRIPDRCELRELAVPDAGSGLAATFAVSAAGAVTVDLVGDGPHAVVGGTTGSGKSELLVAWATALAAAHRSDECVLLCLDFKGGATFDALAGLPHCVGIVTDLDDGEARRVLAGLRAEVRRREHRLRELGVRDLAEAAGAEPRLVVFVDEFQALVQEHPDLYEVFTDLAARGRSLGIHLVLCTQRPTGVFRESLLANCSIRISLRVELESDSRTLLGHVGAAALPPDARGRALLRLGDEPFPVQIAIADAATVAAIGAREAERRHRCGAGEPERPWRPPLPQRLELDGGWWALADLPHEQRQPRIGVPADGDHLWIVGAQRTGKSHALASLAAAARDAGRRVIDLGGEPERAWDLVEALVDDERGATSTLLVIDDLDALEQQFEPEHRAAFIERLQRLARTGRRRALTLAVATRRLGGSMQRLHALSRSTLRLAAASRQEWLLQGGAADGWLGPETPPGRGRLDGELVQVALPSPDRPAAAGAAAPVSRPFEIPEAGLVVAARRTPAIRAIAAAQGRTAAGVPSPAELRDGVEAILAGAPVLIGDLEQWQGAFGAVARLGERVPVLVVGAGAGEWRHLLRGDPLPPAVADGWATGLLRHPDGRVERVRLAGGVPERILARHRLDGDADAVPEQPAGLGGRAVRVTLPRREPVEAQSAASKRLGTPSPSAT